MARWVLLFVVLAWSGCDPSTWLEITAPAEAHLAMEAPCDAPVQGTNGVDIELDYLPHVIKCENGAASYEALKAQAVAARSYLYYKIDKYGTIADGTSDQVYSCDREPSQIHYDAVADTAGIHLVYQDTLVCTFYVAGAHPSDEVSCIATADDPEDFNTEHYVTYNWGYSGDDVQQTHLGWIDEDNLANRGCMSQNGSDCLSDQGWGFEDILRFYYGADIGFSVAEGDCLEEVPCEEDPDCVEDDLLPTSDAGPSGVTPNRADGGVKDATTTAKIVPVIPHRFQILTLNNPETKAADSLDDLPPSVVSSCQSQQRNYPLPFLAFLLWCRSRRLRTKRWDD